MDPDLRGALLQYCPWVKEHHLKLFTTSPSGSAIRVWSSFGSLEIVKITYCDDCLRMVCQEGCSLSDCGEETVEIRIDTEPSLDHPVGLHNGPFLPLRNGAYFPFRYADVDAAYAARQREIAEERYYMFKDLMRTQPHMFR